ncbi:MAG: chorismate synthase, partial [Pseudomonadota bacterium]|nr:chorismate synthase [Pseudomonadota bacterium]
LAQVGPIVAEQFDWAVVAGNDFYFPDEAKLEGLSECIKGLRREGDSIGARVNVIAEQVPRGLGAPVFQRLDAEIASALMSINAVKAVEIGDGFAVV